jgi:hypothetical protein
MQTEPFAHMPEQHSADFVQGRQLFMHAVVALVSVAPPESPEALPPVVPPLPPAQLLQDSSVSSDDRDPQANTHHENAML